MASPPDMPIAISGVISASVPTWAGDATVWLAQMDAFFAANKVTSQGQRYSLLITSLPPALTAEVKDILTSPPGSFTCEQLKAEIIKRTTFSQQERLRQLLNSEELGDRKPSQLLRRMKSLLG